MSAPTLTPASTTSTIVLPTIGEPDNVNASCPYKIYSRDGADLYDEKFLVGAAEQVSYVYKKLGGDVLDIELTEGNVYAAYEEATLEYSYIVNLHQATNIISDSLGNATGSFDDKGNVSAGQASVSLKYPKFEYGGALRTAEGVSADVGLAYAKHYSGSFDVTKEVQDYNLQTIFFDNRAGTEWENVLTSANKKIIIRKVYYKTPHAMWRFFGYYGGLNVVGNLHNYGQFSDDSTFQLIPAWHNKAQALAFEDAIYTRMSHFTFELRDNMIRLFPIPYGGGPSKMWVEFTIPEDSWDGTEEQRDGVNNINTLPLGNIPYQNINSIGKQWIRRFALALCKETLGQVRSKFGSVPIPGDNIQMNGTALISEGKDEQDKLRTELKETLAELTYAKLAERDSATLENSTKALEKVPNYIFVG